jgi:hypothetical protein
MLWQGIYQLPILMGYGAFWALQDFEAEGLTTASEGLLKAIPIKQRQAVMEAMEKWLPITTFVSTVAIITYPRLQQTKAGIAEQRKRQYAQPVQFRQPNTPQQPTTANAATNQGDIISTPAQHESASAAVNVNPYSIG